MPSFDGYRFAPPIRAVSTKRGSEIFFGSGLDTDLPDGLFARKALPLSAIDHHPQFADIDFVANKTRSAVASGNSERRMSSGSHSMMIARRSHSPVSGPNSKATVAPSRSRSLARISSMACSRQHQTQW